MLIILLCKTNSYTQHVEFKKLNYSDEFTDEVTYQIYQDKHQNLWFLTAKGIVKSDGKNARMFGAKDGYTDGGAFRMVEDKTGRLWVVTVSFNLYYLEGNRFIKVRNIPKVCWIDINPQGHIFLMGRHPDEFYIYRLKENLTATYVGDAGFQGYNLMNLDGDNYLVSTQKGVWLIGEDKRIKLLGSDTYRSLKTPRLFRLHNKRIYVSTENGIYEYSSGKTTLICNLQGQDIFDIKEDINTGRIIVCMSSGMLIFPNGFNSKAKKYTLGDNIFLTAEFISSNEVFIGTTRGAYRFNPDVRYITTNNELDLGKVLYVSHETDNVYFFYQNDHFYKLSDKKLSKETFSIRPDIKRQIVQVKPLSDSQFVVFARWYAEFSNSSCKIRFQKNEGMYIKSMLPQNLYSDGNYSLVDQGKHRLVLTRAQLLAFNKKMVSEDINMYEDIMAVRNDTLFFATSKGVVKAVFRNDAVSWHKLIPVEGEITGSIFYGEKLIVSTSHEGIYIIGDRNEKKIDASNHLLSGICGKMQLRKNRLWVGTNKGLSVINLNNYTSVNFTDRDYLLENKVNDFDFYNGQVYVASDKGISIFSESAIATEKDPAIRLTSVSVNNKEQQLSEFYNSSYDHNNYTFTTILPGYRTAPFNRYRMIITGSTMTDTVMHDGTVQLFALSNGKYQMRFDVLTVDGSWSQPTFAEVIINPPFWKTWWFMALIVLTVSFITGYIIWLSVKRQRELQDYKRQLSESELKSLRLYMNPHFLFNSLTSLQSFILTVKTDDANKFITKFSKLIRSVMTYSVKGELKLKEEVALLNSYLELESVRFGKDFTYNVLFDDDLNADEIVIPSLIIQPFVENCIKHGVTGIIGRDCYIHVRFEMRGAELFCVVSDNGKGRKEKTRVEKIHISSGIKFTEERIRLMINDKKREVILFEDTNPGEENPGTTVTILVPVLNCGND